MKSVLITGVCGGIGAATASLFAQRGWHVIGVDQRSECAEAPCDEYHVVDLSSEEQINGLFAQLGSNHSSLHCLVNNAAAQLCKSIVDTTSPEWDAIMAVNLRAAYLMMRQAYPLLQKSAGAIVNVGSVHARATSKNIAAYAASKGGLESLTRSAALEFAADGIRVNGVHPGAVDTQMLRAGLERGHLADEGSDDLMKKIASKHPLGRVGVPEDVAEAIYFLADGKTGFMTGTFLVLDGGVLAHLSSE